MRNYTKTIIYFALICAIFNSCSDKQKNTPNSIVTPVTVDILKKGYINQLINTTGNVNANHSAELVNKVRGYYYLQINPRTRRPFKLGDMVNKGELVIRIEDAEYENNIAVKAKKLAVEIAEQEQTKQSALYTKGGVTLSEMRNSEVKAINARYSYDNAILKLEDMNIIAPFDGVIVDLPHYTKDAIIEINKDVLGVMDYTKLYMEINLPESAIQYVEAKQPVFITHYTLENDTIPGMISEFSPAISTETRTFKSKIMIRNEELSLRPGMFVKVDIVVDEAEEAIVIPKDVIQLRNNQKFVFIVVKNTAILKPIKIGLENEDYAEVIFGLKESDQLVIKGYETLRPNSSVKIQQ